MFYFSLLTEKTNEHQSFEVLSQNVQKKFQKNDFLSVGTLLTLLLKQHDLPETTNRLVAYYILYDMFRVEGTNENESPFSAFLYSLVDSKESLFELTCIERNFIFQLLTHGVRDVSTNQKNWSFHLTDIGSLWSFANKLPINILKRTMYHQR